VRLGEYQVHEVMDGTFAIDGGAMFGVVPRALWARTNPPDSENRILLAARSLLLQGHGRTILVDAGIGEKWNDSKRALLAIDHGRGEIRRSLTALGVDPCQVTDILLTHLHFDHAGALTRRERGDLVLTFPNARVHVQRAQWEWAQSPSEKDRASFCPEDWALVAQRGLLTLHEGDAELFPGIEVRVGHGHSVGHQQIVIHGDERALVFAGDVLPTATHLRAPYIMAFDLFPLATIDEKLGLLTEVHARQWILVFDHEPSFAACRIQRDESGGFSVSERVAL
jgi:glyoxylase-like metal-dependent hydrolase (beta-lactamase superfamily II)